MPETPQQPVETKTNHLKRAIVVGISFTALIAMLFLIKGVFSGGSSNPFGGTRPADPPQTGAAANDFEGKLRDYREANANGGPIGPGPSQAPLAGMSQEEIAERAWVRSQLRMPIHLEKLHSSDLVSPAPAPATPEVGQSALPLNSADAKRLADLQDRLKQLREDSSQGTAQQ